MVGQQIHVGQTAQFSRRFTQTDFNRFADLSGDNNPIHTDPDFAAASLFGRTVAHGMFLYSNISRALGELLPGPGTIQLEQELMFPAPTYSGEDIIVQLAVAGLPGPGLAALSTQVNRADGTPGCQGQTLVRLPRQSALLPQPGKPQVRDAQETRLLYKGLQIGQQASTSRTFWFADLQAYCDLTEDRNPIYLDDGYAKNAGFTGTPIPGPLLAGMFSCLLGTRLPGPGTNWLKQKLIFPAAAYAGEKITAQVEIARVRPEKDLVNLRTTCTNPSGRVVCLGEALVRVKDLEV